MQFFASVTSGPADLSVNQLFLVDILSRFLNLFSLAERATIIFIKKRVSAKLSSSTSGVPTACLFIVVDRNLDQALAVLPLSVMCGSSRAQWWIQKEVIEAD